MSIQKFLTSTYRHVHGREAPQSSPLIVVPCHRRQRKQLVGFLTSSGQKGQASNKADDRSRPPLIRRSARLAPVNENRVRKLLRLH